MKITKYIHSCILLSDGDDSLLFDPGMFTFAGGVTPETFKEVKTIVITHNHPDHLDTENLKKILELSDATVLTTPEIIEMLIGEGIEGDIRADMEYKTEKFSIEAIEAPHESILADEIPLNYAYLVNGSILHVGDSYSEKLSEFEGIDVLLLPLMAPWCTELDTFTFTKILNPKTVIPVHDGYAKDFFLKSRYKNFEKFFNAEGIAFRALANPGDSVEI